MSEQENQDHDVLSQVKRIQQQLGFLEKKIDMLLQQQPAAKPFQKPFERDRFRKPFRPSGEGRPPFRRFDRKEGEGQGQGQGQGGGEYRGGGEHRASSPTGGGFKKFGKGHAKPFFKGRKDRKPF